LLWAVIGSILIHLLSLGILGIILEHLLPEPQPHEPPVIHIVPIVEKLPDFKPPIFLKKLKPQELQSKKALPQNKPEKNLDPLELSPSPPDPKATLSLFREEKSKLQKEKAKVKPPPPKPREVPRPKVGPPPMEVSQSPIAPSPKTSVPEITFSREDIMTVTKESQDLAPSPSKERRKPKLREIIAHLDKYLDLDKYGAKAEYGYGSLVSFEDQGFNYLWYGRLVKKKVAEGWYPPYAARMGLTGRSVVTFKIHRDGMIDEIKLRDSSGNSSLDKAALNAVRSITELTSLPEDYGPQELGVIFSFWYNLTPPK